MSLTAARVVLIADVEKFPHFIARAGRLGTIVYAEPEEIAVRMDEPLPGAEAWDNEVCFYADDDDDGDVIAEALRYLWVLA